MFENRTTAGRELADALEAAGIEADVVLAIPRGGLPVGRAVADALGVPLDVAVAKKLGAPGNAELAIGAVASDGTAWINEELVAVLGISEADLDARVDREREAAAEKLAQYRANPEPVDVVGKRVVLVDDGVATGATTRACLRQLRAGGADEIVLAVPVAPPDALDDLADDADRTVAVLEPSSFRAVGEFYEDFSQVPDADAIAYLEE